MLRILAVVTVVALTTSSAAPDWTTFSPSDAGFTVSMPASPTVSSRLIQSPSGILTTKIASAELSRSSQMTVSWTSYPETAKQPPCSESTLNKMVEALVDARDGANLVQRDIGRGSYKARDVTFSIDNGATVHTRFFIADRRVYQLSAEWMADSNGSSDADRFLDSFKLKA